MTLPSGPGQTTKDKSQSIVHATDDPALALLASIATAVGASDESDAGQATAARQDTGNASLSSVDTKLTSQATAAKQDTGNTSLASIDGKVATAAATSDAKANPTVGLLWSLLSAFNGTTWDRLRSGITTVSSTLTGLLNTLPWAVFNTTPTTRTDGQGGPLQTEADGSLRTSLSTGIAGEDLQNDVLKVEARYSYTPIVTATTTVIKSSAGFLHKIIFNKRVATGVVTVYDNTSAAGTKIGTITVGAAILSDPPNPVEYNCSFATGLTIVTSQAEDITVIWR